MKASEVPALKVAELREALKERGLPTAGTKAVLAERLLAALAAAENKSKEADPPADKGTFHGSGDAPESKDEQADVQEHLKPVEVANAALASLVAVEGAAAPPAANERKRRITSGKPAAADTQEAADMHRPGKEQEAAGNLAELSEKPTGSSAKRDAAGNTAVASKDRSAKKVSDQPRSSGKGLDATAHEEAVEDTAITDVKPEAMGSHETEHEEQVDYGTDDIMAVDEAPEEAKRSGGQAEQQEQLEKRQDPEPPEVDTRCGTERHSEAGMQGAMEVAADADAAATGAPEKAEGGPPISGGTSNPVAANEMATELPPTGGGKEAGEGAKDAGKHASVAEAVKTAPTDPTPPTASSGRKRQPIEFKVDEVEQRVAAKRAARETAAGEAAAAQDKAAGTAAVVAADKSKAQPASTKMAPLSVAVRGATQDKAITAAESPAEEEAQATETSPNVAAPQAAPAEAAANAASAAAGRAVKLQKLDSGGRKASLATATEAVTARLGASAATKKPAPLPLEGPATRALRIEGFVRPFTENQVRQFLSQHGVVEDMWMPTIKKYCYVIFAEVAHGEAAAAATNGLVWPPTNSTSILKPSYMSTEDAADAIANGRSGLADTPRGGSGGLVSPKGAMAGTGPHVGVGARRDTLTAAVAAAAADAAATKQKALPTAAATGANATAGRKRSEPEAESPDADAAEPGKTAPAADAVPVADAAAAPEPPALLLDDLFKKTKSKPIIYWMPLMEEEAATARKKRKEEDAAAQKAEEEAARERARRQQERERDRDRAGERGGSGGLQLPPPPPLPGPPPRDGRGGYDRDRQGYGRDRR
ncbi:hypothetical protein Vretimale_2498 [Volvox reticuliferus]|uniref:Uncharacterized protein n=1 Tax=Volvox reticuliferus TaxID=1737510 RepID=A0A8J4D7Z8_9CHLO|nr:hypothetical protein Vretifemale_4856 [Volvox reticuliferus]GIL96824.1 hypothetical protein Vretimale_2498 [Volvox reticuliferus]